MKTQLDARLQALGQVIPGTNPQPEVQRVLAQIDAKASEKEAAATAARLRIVRYVCCVQTL